MTESHVEHERMAEDYDPPSASLDWRPIGPLGRPIVAKTNHTEPTVSELLFHLCQHPQSADITTLCSAHRRHICVTCGAEWSDREARR